MLKILTVPAETEILRRKSQPVIKVDAELLAFLKELGDTLKGQKDPAGVGLSAIQVGRPIRVFATWLPRDRHAPSGLAMTGGVKPELTFYINPEMVEQAAKMTLGEELVIANGRKLISANHANKRINDMSIHRPSSIVPASPAGRHRPFLEGCLSIPRIYGAVMRYPWIRAKATAVNGDLYYPDNGRCEYNRDLFSEFRLEGLAARVFQHELDHLNGILFTDHVLAQGNKLYREEGKEMVEMEM